MPSDRDPSSDSRDPLANPSMPGGEFEAGGPPVSSPPPPLPESSWDREPAKVSWRTYPVFRGRLHPLTLVFALWHVLRGFLIPLLLLLLLGRPLVLGGFLAVFIGLALLLAGVRYFTFTFRIEGGELITRHGVFSRHERNIPLSRVQDIRIEQGMPHRLFKMADVHVDTAGGHGSEASFSVLSLAEAERLRAAIFEQREAHRAAVGSATEAVAALPSKVICRLGIKDLVLTGLTSNHLASALALMALAWKMIDEALPRERYERFIYSLAEQFREWTGQGLESAWILVGAGVGAALLIGMFFSVAGTILLFYGFTLSRRGEDLHRSYGLITQRSSSLPRRRIQVLKVEENFIRRLCGRVTLKADTAGSLESESKEQKGGRDVFIPILRREEVEALLPEFFPDFKPDESAWRRVSPRAIRRGTLKGSLVCLVLALANYLWTAGSWIALWPLAMLPLVFGLNVMSYRRLGYWLGAAYFRTRRGWLSRAGHLVPIRNAQAVVIHRTPLDRWHGVATIQVDTAGQAFTGGGPKIHNVPFAEAETLGWTLARGAARTRYRL
jgi:putative membrane protein